MREIDLKKLERSAVRGEVLKKAGYKCQECRIRMGSFALSNDSKKYTQLDDFEANFVRSQGGRVVKVFLRVLCINSEDDNREKDIYRVLCPLCSQQYIKKLVQEAKKKKLGNLANVKLLHVVEVKNYIFNVTGRMVSTSDALGLYLRIYEVLNRNN